MYSGAVLNTISMQQNNIQRESNFQYSDYESFVRLKDPQVLAGHRKHLSYFVRYFQGCKRVLDLACGEGIFLDLLRESNIQCMGVEADSAVIRLGKSRGHTIVENGVIEFLESNTEQFDGVFCSHLIEHLPFECVLGLIQGVSKCTSAGGVFVLAFPNPRALRTHLHQFWVDPQHVRFYDSSLIKGILHWSGFQVVLDSDDPPGDSDGYRFASRDLLDAIVELESTGGQIDKLAWLTSPKVGSGVWHKAKSTLSAWIRERLGISMLADEMSKLNRVLTRTVHLIDDSDMEVRLVSKKSS
jgi:2-polyprenyl-3-methyl-5-hydroxy-6-metoxy-1,4-benzoquinol methylase